jgi:hypothetical protein
MRRRICEQWMPRRDFEDERLIASRWRATAGLPNSGEKVSLVSFQQLDVNSLLTARPPFALGSEPLCRTDALNDRALSVPTSLSAACCSLLSFVSAPLPSIRRPLISALWTAPRRLLRADAESARASGGGAKLDAADAEETQDSEENPAQCLTSEPLFNRAPAACCAIWRRAKSARANSSAGEATGRSRRLEGRRRRLWEDECSFFDQSCEHLLQLTAVAPHPLPKMT